MSQIRVNEVVSENSLNSPTFPKGAVATGVITATSFSGDGSQLSGIDMSYSPVAGIATYATTAGIATYATTAGIATNAQGLTGTPDIAVRNIVAVGATFSGDVSIGGTITYQDVTEVDSIGVITARSGINVVTGGITVQAGGVNVSGVGTFSNGIVASPGTTATNSGIGTDVVSGAKLTIRNEAFVGNFEEIPVLKLQQDYLSGNDNSDFIQCWRASNDDELRLVSTSSDDYGLGIIRSQSEDPDENAYIVFNGGGGNGLQFLTSNGSGFPNTWERLKINTRGGFHYSNAEFVERTKVNSGKLSDNLDIDLADGMIHLFQTTETQASVPNIVIDGTTVNSALANGDTISVSIITTAASGGYINGLQIDGTTINDVNWIGGNPPTDGGTSGTDLYAFTIIKTGSSTYTVLGSQTKTS